MSKLFKEYGGVVTVVVAIVALIGLVVFLMTDTGVMANAFGNITGQFVEKSEQLIEDVGSIDGNQAVQTFYTQEPETLSFRSEAPKSEFKEVQVNGTTIGDDCYTVTEGSTIVTLKVEYMGTLPEGTYTLTIVSNSGSVTITFKVVDDVKPEDGNGGPGEPGGSGGVELPAVGTSAKDCTWEQIKAIGDAGKADEYFDLGDTKTFTLTTGETVVMEMVAFNADTKADGSGKAAITWISKDLVAKHAMNSTGNNAGGWEASEMRSWLQGEFYAKMPTEVKDSIVNVNKTYGDYNGGTYTTKTCADDVWIPSQYEMFGANSTTYGCEDSGVSYTGYFTDATRVKSYGGSADYWWLRSAVTNNSGLFRGVVRGGNSYTSSARYSNGVALGFCT